jgi:hypothetical protein
MGHRVKEKKEKKKKKQKQKQKLPTIAVEKRGGKSEK